MNFELRTIDLARACAFEADALLVLLPEADKPSATARGALDAISALARQARRAGDLQAKAGKLLHVYQPAGVSARRLVLCGAGDGSARQVRQAVGAALASLKGAPLARVLVCLAALAPGPGQVRAAVLAAADAAYTYSSTKSKKTTDGKPEPQEPALGRLTVGVPEAEACRAEFQRSCAIALGVDLAREWANRPANHATPAMLAKAAQTLGRHKAISVKVMGPAQVAKLKMGSFMAVAQGSREPLRFIELSYRGAARSSAPLVLVGKGITFDTGGISIKPSAEMDEMKFDMGGAASVLGVFRALAELQPAINVVGLVPSCENMPDGKAVKPGDVVTSMSGQTIEVLNTDAEGRLILCDALTYAERFKPRAVVDIATLTGACVVALGGVRSGMFASSDALAGQLVQAGEAALDPCWRLPLDEDYAEGLKSNFADVANVAGRAAGAVTAAKFLQRFAGAFDWAHLDIAGTAWKSGSAKGATGRPVGLLVEYLMAQATSAKGSGSAAAKPTGRA
jgi:leucyl aminopeptidase